MRRFKGPRRERADGADRPLERRLSNGGTGGRGDLTRTPISPIQSGAAEQLRLTSRPPNQREDPGTDWAEGGTCAGRGFCVTVSGTAAGQSVPSMRAVPGSDWRHLSGGGTNGGGAFLRHGEWHRGRWAQTGRPLSVRLLVTGTGPAPRGGIGAFVVGGAKTGAGTRHWGRGMVLGLEARGKGRGRGRWDQSLAPGAGRYI